MPKNNIKTTLLIALSVLIFNAFSASAQTVGQTENSEINRGYIVNVGDTAPDFALTLTDGKQLKLSDLRGKIVMLQFTASWCGVCRREMPEIEKQIWQKHKNNPSFAMLAIDRDEPKETVEKFIESTGVSYPIGLDSKASIFQLFADKKAGVTRNVIIDRKGKIVMLTRLYNTEEFAQMANLINKLLSE